MEEENLLSKFYYPYCNICKGVLKIYFNDNFTIDYECENYENHKKENIYFETFERFYLKEKAFDYCKKCNKNLESDSRYICEECKNSYCSLCFIYDEHIKKDIKKLNIKTNKCKHHQSDLIYYCKECKKYLCIDCLKMNENGNHEEHEYLNILDIMPTINEINKLKQKIEAKEKAYYNLINSLDDWYKKIFKKVEKLKQKLKKEIEILKKLFFNFNINYAKLAYTSNFDNINGYIKDINNESLLKFYNSDNFEFKTKYLFEYFFPENEKIINKNGKLEYYEYFGVNGMIIKLTNDLFFVYNSIQKNIKIYQYNNYKDKIIYNTSLNFNDNIYTLTSYNNNDSIYICACLQLKKAVTIFIYNLKDKSLKISDIIDDENKSQILYENSLDFSENFGNNLYRIFENCILLSNNLIAIAEEQQIYILKKSHFINKFSKIKTLFNNNPFIRDMILVDNEYFACSICNDNDKTFCDIIYFSINNLEEEKRIKKINCVNGKDSCLFLFNQYLLIKGNKKIFIISNKTKELVQVLSLFSKNHNVYRIIINTNNDIIYILSQKDRYLRMIKYKFIDGLFIQTEDYNKINVSKKDENEIIVNSNNISANDFFIDAFCINEDNDIFLWRNNIFRLIEK